MSDAKMKPPVGTVPDVSEISAEEKHKTLNRVVGSSFLGNFIEWFDYGSYSYFAGVIALLFFPSDDRLLSLMMTFAVFAIAFFVRPLGAIFWGSYGDKHGRKEALSLSILLMSAASFLIGCLPSFYMIGIAAPILLFVLRLVQGFSASGEYAGAATFIAEYAPAKKRGFYCSMVPASTAAGLAAALVFYTVMVSLTGWTAAAGVDTVYAEWLWRIPFWLAGPLGYITHYIRTRLEDSPVYMAMREAVDAGGEKAEDHPFKALFTKHPKKTVLAFLCAMLNAAGFYAVLTFLPNYLVEIIGFSESTSGTISMVTTFLYIFMIWFSGKLSDHFGRKKLLIAAAGGFIILTIPCFMMMGTQSLPLVIAAELIMCLLLTFNDGSLSSYLSETFPTSVRYTGFAFTFNLANALFGGTWSAVSFALIDFTGNEMSPAYYFIVICVVSLVAMLLSHEHSGKDLAEV